MSFNISYIAKLAVILLTLQIIGMVVKELNASDSNSNGRYEELDYTVKRHGGAKSESFVELADGRRIYISTKAQ